MVIQSTGGPVPDPVGRDDVVRVGMLAEVLPGGKEGRGDVRLS
jgi:hypothetical protein